MQKQFLRSLVLGGVLLSSFASAQVYRDRNGSDYRGDNNYGRGDAVSRTLNDLHRVQSSGWIDRRDRDNFQDATKELLKFQDRRRDGRFDRGSLDDAIGEIQRIVNGGRVHPRARDILARDLYSLRDLRSYGDQSYNRYDRGRYDRR